MVNERNNKPRYFSISTLFSRKFLFKSAAAVAVIELGSLALSYAVWKRLNTNQDFRLYMYKNYNWVLEGYYKTGELISGDNSIRELDQTTWRSSGSI
ncbi:protein CEBPZOS-like isoform X2 [Macrosteles quadrilineatus]|uniref:protein CEBPZOS-like isoform X2 n=1 Tax=Macrosteles quadrilineatus TaxID=74068 RepID=UPI0023E2F839|nr:protein CEBPZOS-like isoform X2 [Macrosteles quadrilineatus]XP_054264909.1 protein CEBPZOS-like isoform X2 [Macrosteles quadrilineatus]